MVPATQGLDQILVRVAKACHQLEAIEIDMEDPQEDQVTLEADQRTPMASKQVNGLEWLVEAHQATDLVAQPSQVQLEQLIPRLKGTLPGQ